ncbi:MAG: hypothetical protein AAGG01_00050 [Planctomycetota bacterium]
MTDSLRHPVEEADLFEALKDELPPLEEMAQRVRARLRVRVTAKPGGVAMSDRSQGASSSMVVRLSDRLGLRRTAASILAPILLPLGIVRPGAIGAAAVKGAAPKGLVTMVAMPVVLLIAIALTLRVSVRRTRKLEGTSLDEKAAHGATARWWKEHTLPLTMFGLVLVVLSAISYPTARALICLGGLVSLALSAEQLSAEGLASRRAIAMATLSMGLTVYLMLTPLEMVADATVWLQGGEWAEDRRPFRWIDGCTAIFASAVVTLASLQGVSRWMGPWQLLTRGTDKDLGRVGSVVVMVGSAIAFFVALPHDLDNLTGGVGERLWACRDSLAWIALCGYGMLLPWRAPVVKEERG